MNGPPDPGPLVRQAEAAALLEQVGDASVRALIEHVSGSVVLASVEGRHPPPDHPVDLAHLVRCLIDAFADPVTIARIALGDTDAGDPFGGDPMI